MTQYPAEFLISVWGVTATLSMLLAWYLAYVKNLDVSPWMAWSFLFPPMVIVLFLHKTNPGPRPHPPRANDHFL